MMFKEKIFITAILYLTIMFLFRKVNRRPTILQENIQDKSFRSNVNDLALKIKAMIKNNMSNDFNLSQHFFQSQLPYQIKSNLDNIDFYIRENILKSEPSYRYIPEITEVYVSTKNKKGGEFG